MEKAVGWASGSSRAMETEPEMVPPAPEGPEEAVAGLDVAGQAGL